MKLLKETTVADLFGYTYYKTKAFWLTPEGRYLDGSSGSDRRIIDHREVSNADGVEDMLDFMLQGNIRLLPEVPGIDLIKQPTEKQYKTLIDYINYFLIKAGDFYVDLSNTKGYIDKTLEYNSGIDGYQVVTDIKNYFKNLNEEIVKKGTKYQVRSKKGRNLGTYNTKEEAEKRLKQVEYFKHKNKNEAMTSINNDIIVYTLQDKSVLNLLKDGKIYRANYSNALLPKCYKDLASWYGFNSCPIFGSTEVSKQIIDSSNLGRGKVLLKLKVPIDEVKRNQYYDWSDYLYFEPDNWDEADISKTSLIRNLKNQVINDKSTEQIILDRIEPNWLINK